MSVSNLTTSRALQRTNYCEHPIRLRGIRLDTGEIKDNVYVPCGTRRRSKCIGCSDVYEQDAYHVAASGWNPEASYAWVTLTAPGAEEFGCQHHVFCGTDGKRRCTPRRKCPGCGNEVPACKRLHKQGDPLIGVPVCDCFDYAKAAAFNGAVSALWTETMELLNEAMELADGRLQYIKVFEFQRRGLVHAHALIRGVTDAETVLAAVQLAEHNGFTWGENSKVEIIGPQRKKRAKRAFSYLCKYATKSVADNEQTASRSLREHLQELRRHSAVCPHKLSRNETVEEHAKSCRRLRASLDGLGHAGHVLTKSHDWGSSFAEQRRARREYAASGEHIEWIWEVVGYGYELGSLVEDALAYKFLRLIRQARQQTGPPFVWRIILDAEGETMDDALPLPF